MRLPELLLYRVSEPCWPSGLIVLELASDDPIVYEELISEVTHNKREDVNCANIKETLEYLDFLSVDKKYVLHRDSELDLYGFGSGWKVLVVQNLDQETPSVGERGDEPITILPARGFN